MPIQLRPLNPGVEEDLELIHNILSIMRAYFSRPSSVHRGKSAVLWKGCCPRIRRDLLGELREDDKWLLNIYKTACSKARREAKRKAR